MSGKRCVFRGHEEAHVPQHGLAFCPAPDCPCTGWPYTAASVEPDPRDARIAELVAEVAALRGYYDDPTMDATDGAHPAWWRGQEHGARKAMERVTEIEAELARMDPILRAIAKADKHPPFADGNHAFGVIFEELTEYLDEVRDHNVEGMRQELWDIAGAAIKAARQL